MRCAGADDGATARDIAAKLRQKCPAATGCSRIDAAVPANGVSGPPRKLTLKEAEALALRNNPQITIGKLRSLEAREYVREARSALLPTAYLSLTAVDSDPGGRITAGGLTNPTVFPRAAAGATVSQLVTDFGRTTNLVSSSKFQAKAEDQNAAATTADIILAVDQAFYNSLETLDLVTVAEQTVQARQTLVDKIQALTNAKLRSDLDLSFAKVDVARAKLLLLESQNNFQTALAALSAILGYQDEQNFDLATSRRNDAAAGARSRAADHAGAATATRAAIAAISDRVGTEKRRRRARSCGGRA